MREVCEAAGFTDVRTLLASGNLIVNSKLSGAKLEAKLEKLILDELKLKTDVFVRNAEQIDAVIAANPFVSFFALAKESGTVVLRWTGDEGFAAEQRIDIAVE